MAFVLVSVFIGELAVILCPSMFARVCVTVLGLLQGNFKCPWVSGLLLQFMSVHLHVLVVLQCVVFGASCSSRSVLVFFPPSSASLIFIRSIIIKSLFLHWTLGSVWWVFGQGLGVVGGACSWVVGKAGFGVLTTWVRGRWLQPQVPRHPTSMWDLGIKLS